MGLPPERLRQAGAGVRRQLDAACGAAPAVADVRPHEDVPQASEPAALTLEAALTRVLDEAPLAAMTWAGAWHLGEAEELARAEHREGAVEREGSALQAAPKAPLPDWALAAAPSLGATLAEG
jgi:hypothetical protein